MAVFGWARGDDRPHAAANDGAERFLCGVLVHRIDTTFEYAPHHLHDGCREALFGPKPKPRGRTVSDPFNPQPEPLLRTVACPECGGRVAVRNGRVAAHGESRVRRGLPVETREPCDGAGTVVDGAA